MKHPTELPVIAFIGGGNMATAMVNGLIASGYPAQSIIVADPNEEQGAKAAQRFGVPRRSPGTQAAACP